MTASGKASLEGAKTASTWLRPGHIANVQACCGKGYLCMEGFLRPEIIELPESALVPEKNIISPAPNQFTHKLIRSQPFYYDKPRRSKQPGGKFVAGTKVVLLVYNGGKYCRVVDGQGLYVEVEYDSLNRL